MEWERILADSVTDGKVKELHLKKIPVLKTCNNWREVEPIGWVDHQMKFSYYKGGLVKLKGNIYFVPEKTINALSEYINWKFPLAISVYKD
ncbi:MAG TPA: hypothetical protein VLM75_01785 [Spirochaetota bacterium]|nr:hypothetical protein [Spirochaetota bacterium]